MLLILSGFFSGSETALCALTRSQVERLRLDPSKGSVTVVRFVDDPRRLFITILLGNTFVNITFATLTASLVYQLFGSGPSGAAIATATVVITLALLVFGEITPKSFAIRHADKFARVTAPILWGFSIIIFPLRRVIRRVTDLLLPLFGGIPGATDSRITLEDLKSVVDATGGGALDTGEREIIVRVLELREIEARDVMVPRVEMVAMPSSASIRQVLQSAADVGFSRIPIYRNGIDDICGVFRVKDWLRWRDDSLLDLSIEEFLARRENLPPSTSGGQLVHAPFFTPETRRLSDLSSELCLHRTKVAFLVDSFGGVSGSLTLEDIIEEVVGEIVDEHDRTVSAVDLIQRPGDPRVFELAGRVPLRRVNRALGLDLAEARAETIGGYVLSLFERIPDAGESVADAGGVTFEVTRIVGRRVASVVITLPGDGS